MKMYDGVLKRVRQMEQKKGISYINSDGNLFKVMKVFFILSFAYTMFINLTIILGYVLRLGSAGIAKERIAEAYEFIITTSVVSVTLIASLVLLQLKKYIPALIVNVLPSAYALLFFKKALTDVGYNLGLDPKFYWSHLIPIAINIIAIGVMSYIALRAACKLKKNYKKVTEDIYEIYSKLYGTQDSLSDEHWDKFLSEYDPDKEYKKPQEAEEE